MAEHPNPTEIKLHQESRLLEIKFDNQTECSLSCEFLRVYSPSAEVQGHSPSQAVLQIGKEKVNRNDARLVVCVLLPFYSIV